MKEEIKEEFKENGCEKMWSPTYNLPEAYSSWIIADCQRRSTAILYADDATDLELKFSKMVEGWE